MIAHAYLHLQLHVDPTMVGIEEECNDGVKWVSEEEASVVVHLVMGFLEALGVCKVIFETGDISCVEKGICKTAVRKKIVIGAHNILVKLQSLYFLLGKVLVGNIQKMFLFLILDLCSK
jgi:hypothetical protein